MDGDAVTTAEPWVLVNVIAAAVEDEIYGSSGTIDIGESVEYVCIPAAETLPEAVKGEYALLEAFDIDR